ncbi:30S ribosomal protein S8 [Gammaproteobacteria bacterium]|nr:30S ribosomal protein S8 [Gammaproteobacteria bacterium]
MTMQDPIADMLTRIRNAQAVGEKQLTFPSSTIKLSILNVLKEEGYILDYTSSEVDKKKQIVVILKYYEGRPVIEKIKRASKPSLRLYKNSKEIPTVRAGLGIAIVSTSKGVMTDSAARAQKIGGEVLCYVE